MVVDASCAVSLLLRFPNHVAKNAHKVYDVSIVLELTLYLPRSRRLSENHRTVQLSLGFSGSALVIVSFSLNVDPAPMS